MRLAQRWGQRVPEKPVQQRLKPLVNVIRRNFIRFRSVAQQYIKLGSFDLGDSYEIEISWATTNTKNQVLLGDSHTSTYYLNISSSIAWWSNGNAYSFSPGSEKIQDGRVKTLRVISALNSIRMILNGIELQRLNSAAYTPYQGSVDNILFGSSNSNPATFDGYLPGLRIWTGGDRDSGTLTDEWLLDDALDNSNIIRSTTATEGDNVAVNKDDVVLQNSKSLGITASVITSGSTYLVKIPAGLRLSGPSGWTTRNSTGGEFLHTANASGAFTVLNISGSPVVLGDLSVKEITGGTYGIAINLDDTSSTTFEYDDESDKWIGPDLITQSVWESPVIVGSQWDFNNNRWTLIGDGDLNVLALLLSGEQPDNMRVSGVVESIAGAGLRASSTSLSKTLLDTVGGYSFYITKAEASSQLYKRAYGPVTATITKPSLREVLEVSQ